MPYIDRDEIINAKVPYDDELSRYDLGWNDAIDAIAEMPTADVQEMTHGKWIDPAAENIYRCSICEEYTTLEVPRMFYHYCPNCGAEMRGEEDG